MVICFIACIILWQILLAELHRFMLPFCCVELFQGVTHLSGTPFPCLQWNHDTTVHRGVDGSAVCVTEGACDYGTIFPSLSFSCQTLRCRGLWGPTCVTVEVTMGHNRNWASQSQWDTIEIVLAVDSCSGGPLAEKYQHFIYQGKGENAMLIEWDLGEICFSSYCQLFSLKQYLILNEIEKGRGKRIKGINQQF